MNKKLLITAVVIVILAGGYVLYHAKDRPIGGDRDANGCLVAAGYSFGTTIGACARSFELTPDIANAARLAVEKVGKGYALTVVSFNSYEDGTYEITLERGIERTRQVVRIQNGEASIVGGAAQ